MKRDMNLIRLLLLSQEGEKIDLSGYTENQIIYHGALLIEAGLIDGKVQKGVNGEPAGCICIKLTWAGHDFLDAARNEGIWNKVMNGAKSKGISLTFALAKEFLLIELRKHMGVLQG